MSRTRTDGGPSDMDGAVNAMHDAPGHTATQPRPPGQITAGARTPLLKSVCKVPWQPMADHGRPCPGGNIADFSAVFSAVDMRPLAN